MFSSDQHNSENVLAAMKAVSGKALGNMDFTAWNLSILGKEKSSTSEKRL